MLDTFGKSEGEVIKLLKTMLETAVKEREYMAISWIEVRNEHDFDTWKKAFKSKKADFMKMPKDNVKHWKAIFAYAHLDISMKAKK